MIALPHILIVEDNQDDYEAAERSFRRAHFINPISWCQSGQAALDFLHYSGQYAMRDTPQPDLVLLDLNMPGIDGRKFLRIVKNDDVLKSIPVVVLTTSTASNDIEDCYALGASTYIHKPVEFHSLADAIRTMKDYWFGIAVLPKQYTGGENP
jgi:two-component system, response regulator